MRTLDQFWSLLKTFKNKLECLAVTRPSPERAGKEKMVQKREGKKKIEVLAVSMAVIA